MSSLFFLAGGENTEALPEEKEERDGENNIEENGDEAKDGAVEESQFLYCSIPLD